MENSCVDCVHSRMYESDQQDMPVFKCHRYPPQVFYDADGEIGQVFPDAWMSCGEFMSAGKTQHVVGRIERKETTHALDILGHLLHLRTIRRGRDHTHDHEADQEAP